MHPWSGKCPNNLVAGTVAELEGGGGGWLWRGGGGRGLGRGLVFGVEVDFVVLVVVMGGEGGGFSGLLGAGDCTIAGVKNYLKVKTLSPTNLGLGP